MQSAPDFDPFRRTYEAGRPQVVWTTLVADLETPVSAMLKLTDGRPNGFLFESVQGGATRGRYSFIGLKPDLIWRCRAGKAEINRRARLDGNRFETCAEPPLQSLRSLVQECRMETPASLPPMVAGLFGYLGYDMVRQMERLPDKNKDVLGVPESILLRPTVISIFDNVEDLVTVVTPAWPRKDLGARAAYDQACERLGEIVDDFDRNLPHQRDGLADLDGLPEPTANMTREAFHAMVLKAKEYIYAGDIFQAVLSQRFSLPFKLPPLSLYRALRRVNPSPFLFHLDLDGFSIVGSSPEILVRLRDGKVTIRPIAGTRRRGATPQEDQSLARDLLSDPKELAEHLMLLDLGRNDVGRVAKIGSVKVTQRNEIEYYSHVMHIVSNVEGDIEPQYDALDALIAGFPAGTVSGAPKVRAMEIIDELEKEKRGLYAGSVGYFSAAGEFDSCIILRTALIKDGVMHVQAGAGIVADSNPKSEQQECVDKAKALFRAAEEAKRFASGVGG